MCAANNGDRTHNVRHEQARDAQLRPEPGRPHGWATATSSVSKTAICCHRCGQDRWAVTRCDSIGPMATSEGSTQRSFRLSRRTLEQLDAMARATGESSNALADRLLSEAIKTATHPLIRFQPGALGRRRALVVGTRL